MYSWWISNYCSTNFCSLYHTFFVAYVFPFGLASFNPIGSFGPFYSVESFHPFGYILFASFPIIMVVNGLGLSESDNYYKTPPLLLFNPSSYSSTGIELDSHFDSSTIPWLNQNRYKNNPVPFRLFPFGIISFCKFSSSVGKVITYVATLFIYYPIFVWIPSCFCNTILFFRLYLLFYQHIL